MQIGPNGPKTIEFRHQLAIGIDVSAARRFAPDIDTPKCRNTKFCYSMWVPNINLAGILLA